MTQKNSLMEWLEQTRRISKSVDIICCETIDAIIDDALPYLRPTFLRRNRKFFEIFGEYYHKDNPIELTKRKKFIKDGKCGGCEQMEIFVQGSIDRCWKGMDMVLVQWCEVVDLFWDRPELVNPALIDDYIKLMVAYACKKKNKKNPLKDGMWEHFGKHWKDRKGRWHPERRRRF